MKKVFILIAVLCLGPVIGQPAAADINDGLVGYWPFEGGSYEDFSGNEHHGIQNGSPVLVEGKVGDALHFTGGQRVTVGTWDPAEGTGQMSLSVWVKWDGLTGGYMGVMAKRDGWADGQVRWYLEGNDVTGNHTFGSYNLFPWFDTNIPPIGEWQHFMVTFDGTNAEMYVDGVSKGVQAFQLGSAVNAGIVIGCVEPNGANPYNGAIDEPALWNRALTAAEVAELYNGGAGMALGGAAWKATNPTPANGATGILVSEDLVLRWEPPDPEDVPPGPITEYDVFFATDRGRIAEPNGMDAHVATVLASEDLAVVIPASWLARDLTYYWRVDAVVNRAAAGIDPNIAYGHVWWFETEKSTPVITVQPVTDVVDMGGAAHLTVGVSSPSEYTVTWYKVGDGVDTQVGTGETLTVEDVGLEDFGKYYAIATNAAGDSPPSKTAWIVIRKQLVAYYKCDDDLTAGTTVVDSSAYGNHGVARGNTASAAGFKGGAITFDGNVDGSGGDWVECGRFNPSEGTGEMTVVFWTQWGGSTGTWQSIVSKRDSWGANDMYWQITAHYDNQHRVQIETDGSWPWLNQNVLPIGEWKHVAITFDGTDARLYFDGTLVGGPAGFAFSNDTEAMVNLGGAGSGNDPYLGALDEVKIYNYALTPEEVAEMYMADTGAQSVCRQYHQYDFDRNCYVDLGDLAVLAANWMNCNIVPLCIP